MHTSHRDSHQRAPVAVVTGAARGLGQTIAAHLASCGYDLVVTARRREDLDATVSAVERAGRTAWPRELDLHDDAVDELADSLSASGIHPDVLVNNAGVGGPSGVLWELDRQGWDETLSVNTGGTFSCCRAFAPGMIRRGRGSIVTVGSATGKAPLFGRTPYAASKLALVGLTRTLAAELGPHGIRVNLVSPANVTGDRLDWVIRHGAAAEGVEEAEIVRRMTGRAALKRLVAPEEVAAVVAFLASDAASAVTGEDVNVSAGFVTH